MTGLNGLVIMKPTSVSSTVGTSSIGTDGRVTFSLCETISLNGVFTSSYDNYMISLNQIASTVGLVVLTWRLRASGADSATSNTYVLQNLSVTSTSLSGARYALGTTFDMGYVAQNARAGETVYIFGPALAEPTINKVISNYTNPANNITSIRDTVGTHNLNVAYDGFTLIGTAARPFSGTISVYGFNQ